MYFLLPGIKAQSVLCGCCREMVLYSYSLSCVATFLLSNALKATYKIKDLRARHYYKSIDFTIWDHLRQDTILSQHMSYCKWYFRENEFDWAFMMSSEAGEKYRKINSGDMGREYIPLFCWLIIKKTRMTMTVERSLPSLTTLLLPYFKFFSPLMHKYKPVLKYLLNKFKIGLPMAHHESFFLKQTGGLWKNHWSGYRPHHYRRPWGTSAEKTWISEIQCSF